MMTQKSSFPKLSLWNHAGPALLLGAFGTVLMKCAPAYLPLILAACAGYALTRYVKKIGFYLSLGGIAAALILTMRAESSLLWPLLLAASLSLSFLLILLSHVEIARVIQEKEEKCSQLAEQCQALEKQIRDLKASVSHERSEKYRLHTLYLETKSALGEALGKKEAIPIPVIPPQDNTVPFEQEDPEEKFKYVQLQHQHANLREQFEEKSRELDLTRKELFQIENALLALKKKGEEELCAEPSQDDLRFVKDLMTLEQEYKELENEVAVLQECITTLSSVKKASRPRKSKAKEPSLPLLLQEKIDQTSLMH